MSISRQSRQLFRDLFRMLDEPLMRPGFPSYFGGLDHLHRPSLFDSNFSRPALDVREEGNKYILEAELPGVRKDNIQVRIGDGGQSVTIEGRVVERSERRSEEATNEATKSPEGDTSSSTAVTHSVASDEAGNQISSERTFVNNTTFRRTVWLPRPVDSEDVAAKLDHGILTITVKKAQDKESIVVPVD
ncbi:hypothetical protein H0H92_002549 [Tricholoma furcatifolium]|nr:hypothetical protein H0H92_002549 [Tricholoma furcatifolium]